jgi:hypothetical protein
VSLPGRSFSGEGRAGLLWGAALAALLVVQWSRFLFTDLTFYFRDLTFFSAPLLSETARQWAAGVIPAWNPRLACGAPLAADPNAQAFFPDQALLVLFGGGLLAVKIVLLFRLFLVPLAAYAALRFAPLSPAAAFLGAALLSLSGPVASTLSSFNAHLAGAIFFIPLAVAGFRLAGGGRRAAIGGALAAGLVVLAGSPELAAQGAIVFAICAFRAGAGGAVRRGLAVLGAGVLLAAPLWVPAAALYPRTPRGLGWPLATPPGFLSFPPVRMLEFFWPGLLGDPASAAANAYWGRGMTGGVTPYLLSVSVGLLPWLLLPATLRHPLGRRLVLAAALFLVLSFGSHLPAGDFLLRAPVLGTFRYPEKWLLGATLALAASAGAGAEALRRDESGRLRRQVSRLAVFVGAVSAALLAASALGPDGVARLMRGIGLVDARLPAGADAAVAAAARASALHAAVAAFGCLAIVLWPRTRGPGVLLAGLLAALAIGERLPLAVRAVPGAPLDALRRTGPEVAAARSAAGGGRFFYDREATTRLDPLRPFTGILHGLSYAGNTDVDQFSDARSRAFADAVQGMSFADERKVGLLRLADVRVVDTSDPAAAGRPDLSPIGLSSGAGGRRLYRLEGATSGRMLYHAIRVDGLAEAVRHLRARGLPLETVGIVEGMDGLAAPPAPHGVGPLTFPGPNAFRVEVRTASDGLLQLPITCDPGWRVRVDGRGAAAVPVDVAFLGVPVPAGTHVITGEYRAPGFAAGAVLSLAGLALLAITLLRRGSPHPVPLPPGDGALP